MKKRVFTVVVLTAINSYCFAQQNTAGADESKKVKSSFSDPEKSYRDKPEYFLRALTASQQQLRSLSESVRVAKDDTEKLALMTKFNAVLGRSKAYQGQLKEILNKIAIPSSSAEDIQKMRSAVNSKLPDPFILESK